MATSLALEDLEPTDAVGAVFAGGEESALREAYDIHSKLIYAFCRRSIPEDRAMDVTQECSSARGGLTARRWIASAIE